LFQRALEITKTKKNRYKGSKSINLDICIYIYPKFIRSSRFFKSKERSTKVNHKDEFGSRTSDCLCRFVGSVHEANYVPICFKDGRSDDMHHPPDYKRMEFFSSHKLHFILIREVPLLL